jgi:hypothetical protein
MTKAEKMREVMEKAMEGKRVAYAEKNRKYANRIVNEKCYKRATKGYNNCEVKISRWYSPTLVAETIEKMGFEIKRNSKNGRAVLVIKW